MTLLLECVARALLKLLTQKAFSLLYREINLLNLKVSISLYSFETFLETAIFYIRLSLFSSWWYLYTESTFLLCLLMVPCSSSVNCFVLALSLWGSLQKCLLGFEGRFQHQVSLQALVSIVLLFKSWKRSF